MRSFHRILFGCILSFLLGMASISLPVYSQIPLESGCWMKIGEVQQWGENLPDCLKRHFSLRVEGEDSSVFSPNFLEAVTVSRENPLQIEAVHSGQSRVSLMLWDKVPLKTVEVKAQEPKYLIPGGHSIGVMVHSQGVMIVGFAPVMNEEGEKICPAGDAGLRIGDRIITVNGQKISGEEELAGLVHQAQKNVLHFEIQRNHETMNIDIQPVYCAESQRFRIGLYVRDQIAGIGTLSFWDPETHLYAALGHVILDADTREAIEVGEGRIVSAPVRMIQPGLPGAPGEKVGIFKEEGDIQGSVLKNSLCGIYGIHPGEVHNELVQGPLEVLQSGQVHLGRAEMLTVIEGEKIERFDVEIVRLYPGRSNGKNMLIEITDPRLLETTGGIIQGMSGSPIIQDGKLAGAVTYVLLNDPARGYGIFIENMLETGE